MIRVLLWKEYREHRAIWLTLAFVSGAGLYGLSRLMGPLWGLSYSGARESLQSVAVLFAWTYGLVCGAMLLANENEAGTMTFLDILPVRRIELWLVKCLFGVFLLVAQVAVLTGFVVGLGIAETTGQLLFTLLAMLFFGLFSLSWSLLFSARGENVLNVIGLAFVGQIAGVLATSLALMILAIVSAILWRGSGEIAKVGLLSLGALGLTLGPAVGSARLFTRLDRERRGSALAQPGLRRPPVTSVWASWVRLLWLTSVQMRRLSLGMTIFALTLGCFLPVIGPVGWPALTLIVGVLCGVTVWSDEQFSTAFRFLGDQRFPLGRIWIIKVGTRFALALFASFLMLLPSLVLAMIHHLEGSSPSDHMPFFADLLHCSLVGPIVPVSSHLFLWLLYGFTAGQLSGMLFRKSLVAGVVALGSAAMLVCLWIPSLLGIGLHFWQVAGVPLCLLAAGWLLMPAWAADRLLARATFVRLGSALLAAGLWTTGGLWYRVAEIQGLPDPFDVQAFEASIPSLDKDKNDAGLAIRAAWGEVDKMMVALFSNRQGKVLFPELQMGVNGDTFYHEINAALELGWPNRPSELGKWLDEKFDKEWYCSVLEAAFLPLGVVEDPKQMTDDQFGRGQGHHWGNLAYLNHVLVARGLQRQAGGDHWTFVDNLRICLALSRNLQHCSPPWIAGAGRRAEMVGIIALDRWLEKLPNYPDLLESARDILLQHEAELPDIEDPNRVSYLIARNSLEQVPEILIENQIHQTAFDEHATRELGRPELRKVEIDAAALFWRIPWERERHERILRQVFHGNSQLRRENHKWGIVALTVLRHLGPGPRSKRDHALLHAAQLKVALRLYQAKNDGKLPATLKDLVPGYLSYLPKDPFAGKPFHYRVSRGEWLARFNDARAVRPPLQFQPAAGGAAPPGARAVGQVGFRNWVPPGQAILWSVGEDGRDDGGLPHHGPGDAAENLDPELIYLVPPPPR